MSGRRCPQNCTCKKHRKWATGPVPRDEHERLATAARGLLSLAKDAGLESNKWVRELRRILDGH